MARTVNDLLDELRSQLDEKNVLTATPTQLLAALNRGQRKAVNILSRKNEDMFWEDVPATTTSGSRQLDIPAKAQGRKIEGLYVSISGTAYKLHRISNHKKADYIHSSQSNRPYYYTVVKNKVELFPMPSSGLSIVVQVSGKPETLVVPQGRITSVNTASNYILVDEVGEDVSTSVTGFAAYVNFICYTTGRVKGTCQVNAIDEDTGQITFKTAGLTRSTVLGKTIDVALPDDLEADDYICLVTGSCVPELDDALCDYILQFAVVETKRAFGEPSQEDYAALKEAEKDIEKSWSGQEARNRVKKASQHWKSGVSAVRRLIG